MDNLYLGLPQYIWDDLCQKAEDISFEEFPGTFVVGIFPCGGRLYGLETEPAEILYLYVDTPDELLNPFHKSKCRQQFNISSTGGNVYFYNLFSWIKDCVNETYYKHGRFDITTPLFYDLIPCFSNPLYLEDGIEPIIDELTNYLLNSKSKEVELLNCKDILSYRTLAIWKIFKKFQPCIRNEWGKVFPIEKLIDEELTKTLQQFYTIHPIDKKILLEQEKRLIEKFLNNEFVPSKMTNDSIVFGSNEYIIFIIQVLKNIEILGKNTSLDKLIYEVKRFYKALI